MSILHLLGNQIMGWESNSAGWLRAALSFPPYFFQEMGNEEGRGGDTWGP